MITVDRILIIIILLWIATYTASFGKWTWKRRNRLGAAMVFLVALAAIVLPIYALFIRG
jgi:predicted membrane channel-forming protein YqfA (hemolysin III family)